VRPSHLERLRPVCPACRLAERDAASPLELGTVVRDDGDDVVEGVLLCAHPQCRREHPIIDGIAVVVADLRSWATHQLGAVLHRDDLSPFLESLLGDAAGPGGEFDRTRGNLSGYGRSHWSSPDGGGVAQLAGTAFAMLDGGAPAGVWLEVGCCLGRATVELARRTGDLSVGVDLNFAMLRVAERVRREGRAVYPERRVGLVYDRREVDVPDVPADHLSFWCADAAALPFGDGVFDGALSLNVLDCVASPVGHLLELGRTVRGGAPVLLSTPYDWAPTATAVENWVGGHSQRGPAGGSSEAELHRVLSEDAAAGIDTGLVIEDEQKRVPWRVYVNERATMDYAVHMVRLRKRGNR
jgi:SAM-dependent methyltransferase/uncharacterized protein YbaR (Trm112 family)